MSHLISHRLLKLQSKRIDSIFIIVILSILGITQAHSQKVAVKTNLLYGGYTYTPNLSIELGLGKRSTLDLGGGYNWQNRNYNKNNRKIVHWLGEMEYRYWTCQKFSGHFIGIHLLGTQYNIAGYKLPLLFGKDSENHRFEGWGAGGGISYGYQFYLGKRWSLEANVGVGYAYLRYKKYDCVVCGDYKGNLSRNYLGPTKAGISLVYIIK